MPSRSLQTLAERLERRWRYVCEAEWMAIGLALNDYLNFISAEQPLQGAVSRLPTQSWEERAESTDLANAIGQIRHLPFRPGPEHLSPRGSFGFALLKWCSGQSSRSYSDLTARLDWLTSVRWRPADHTSQPLPSIHEEQVWKRDYLVQTYLRPLHEYLLDALDTNVETLAAMRWFQHWAQWFGASRFEWERRLEDEAVKAGKGKKEYEKRFQLVLFEKLFEYGLHLDLSREPNTAAGSPDFTVIQRTSTGLRPIVVEAKILDKATDPRAALGNLQIRRYMDALHADTGYLVLFDVSVDGHHVELGHRLDDLPYLPVADGRQVYVIHAPIVSQTSASKADPTPLNIESFKFDLK